MSDIEFVDELPAPQQRRDLKKYADAAKADKAGRWVKLPFPPDPTGCVIGNLKRVHHVEARTIKGVTYCRRPQSA